MCIIILIRSKKMIALVSLFALLLSSSSAFLLQKPQLRSRNPTALGNWRTYPSLHSNSYTAQLSDLVSKDLSYDHRRRGGATVARRGLILGVSLIMTTLVGGQGAFAANLIDSISQQASDSGFVQAFLLIFVSEIGDKTFFIAALLAAKYGRVLAFTGSLGALAVMTVISTVLGQIFHAIPSSLTQGVPIDDIIAVLAFTFFGINTLVEASKLKENDNSGLDEEKEEAEKSVEELTRAQKRSSALAILAQTFSLVFAAEIGDRSFLSTIALSAALNPYAVCSGAVIAHGTATGVAVVGGSILSKYLSEKVIGYIGGTLFLVFALTTALGIF